MKSIIFYSCIFILVLKTISFALKYQYEKGYRAASFDRKIESQKLEKCLSAFYAR